MVSDNPVNVTLCAVTASLILLFNPKLADVPYFTVVLDARFVVQLMTAVVAVTPDLFTWEMLRFDIVVKEKEPLIMHWLVVGSHDETLKRYNVPETNPVNVKL